MNTAVHPGARIRQLRERFEISRYALAKQAGVSLSFLNDLEKEIKEPTVSTLTKICSALGVSLAEFFTDESMDQVDLPPDLRELLAVARTLTPEQRNALVHMGRVIQASGSAVGAGRVTAQGDVIRRSPTGEPNDEN